MGAGFLKHTRWRAVILAGLLTTFPVATGCGGPSHPLEVKLTEEAQKAFLMRKMDVQQRSTSSSKSRSATPRSKRSGQ